MKQPGRHPIIIRNIETSRGVVQYNIYDFLKEIKNKPIIWDRMHIHNRNAAISEENWKLLAKIFVPYIGELDEEESTQIIDELKRYWLQLRKGMMKCILTAKKGGNHCHYLHYMEFFLNSKQKYLKDFTTKEELQRLVFNEIKYRAMAGLPPPEKPNSKRPHENNKDQKASVSSKKAKTDISLKPSSSSGRAIVECTPNDYFSDPMSMCETTSQQTCDDDVDDVAVVQNNGLDRSFDYRQQQQSNNIRLQRFVNESAETVSSDLTNKLDGANQAFFDSIKPTLRNLNDTQKLDFKIEVLKTLKKYKLY